MSKKILIDTSNSTQTRIAVTQNDRLDEFEIESNRKNSVKGDVYLAKITRVEPSLQAAFVDFGANRNGFLPLTEIHPDYFKIPSADQEDVKKLYDQLTIDDNENDDVKKDLSKKVEEEEVNEDENLEDNNPSASQNNRIKIRNPKKEYVNYFRKYN